jgi:hypothetical protein
VAAVLPYDERRKTAILIRQFRAPVFVTVREGDLLGAIAGLVGYWRERGWPDLCHPMGADDFVCD